MWLDGGELCGKEPWGGGGEALAKSREIGKWRTAPCHVHHDWTDAGEEEAVSLTIGHGVGASSWAREMGARTLGEARLGKRARERERERERQRERKWGPKGPSTQWKRLTHTGKGMQKWGLPGGYVEEQSARDVHWPFGKGLKAEQGVSR